MDPDRGSGRRARNGLEGSRGLLLRVGIPFTENLKVFFQGGGVASLRVAVLAHNNCVLRTLSDIPLSLDEGTPPGVGVGATVRST